VAIAPLLVAIRTAGAAALRRTAAQLRAMAAAVRAAAARAAAAARTTSTYTGALGRLATALRRVAIAALMAARAIGGSLVRAMRQAVRAAFSLLRTMTLMAARWAAIGTPIIAVGIALVPVIGNLLGLSMLLAPAVVAVAAAFATWKLATNGFGDALNATDTEELADALKKLSPNARQAALTLRDLRAEWKSTQQRVQDAFFKGARKDFIMLSRAIQPIADRWLPKLATAFGNLRTWMSQVFTAAADSGQLDKIMAGVQRFVDGITAAIPYLAQAFLDIAEVAAPSFGDLGDSISGAAQKFADWIRKLKEDGTLKAWLDKAKTTFQKVMDIGKEIGGIFADIFKGAGDGDGFLDNLKKSIQEFRDWLKSDNGQEFIKGMLRGAEAIANLIVWIGKASDKFAEFREWVRSVGDNIKGIFSSIGAAASGMFGVIGGGVNAFAWIGGVISRMGGLVAAVRGAVSGINAALSAIRTSVFIDIITRRFDSGSKGYAKGISSTGGGNVKFYAEGGPFRAGETAVVGENGPELVQFGRSGRVYSNRESMAMAGGGGSGVKVALSIAPGAGHGANPMVAAVIRMFRDRQIVLRDAKGQPVRLAGA
jgi:hypothetical protein